MKFCLVVPLLGTYVGPESSHWFPVFALEHLLVGLARFLEFGKQFHLFLFLLLEPLLGLFLQLLPLSLLPLELVQKETMDHMEGRNPDFFIFGGIMTVFGILVLFGGEMGRFVFDDGGKSSRCIANSTDLCEVYCTFWWLLVLLMRLLLSYRPLVTVFPFELERKDMILKLLFL